jgi:hypothetical protein
MNWARLRSGMRRYAWTGMALWLLVAIGAAASYLRTPPQYIATQRLDVALVPVGEMTAANQQQLDAQAATIARAIASPGFLVSLPFATAVSQQFSALSGLHASTSLSPQQAATSLSAMHSGAHVTISARAGTPGQSELLAQSAAQALALHADELLPGAPDATIRIIPDASPPHVARDAAAGDMARDLLLARLGLATTTALLMVIALGWIDGRIPGRSVVSSSANEGAKQATA